MRDREIYVQNYLQESDIESIIIKSLQCLRQKTVDLVKKKK